MKRHDNKHWKREKYYISLLTELDRLHDLCGWLSSNSEIDRVKRKLKYEFYGLYYGWTSTAPKKYRNQLNRCRRKKSKNTLKRELQGYQVSYDDNYKDGPWYW